MDKRYRIAILSYTRDSVVVVGEADDRATADDLKRGLDGLIDSELADVQVWDTQPSDEEKAEIERNINEFIGGTGG